MFENQNPTNKSYESFTCLCKTSTHVPTSTKGGSNWKLRSSVEGSCEGITFIDCDPWIHREHVNPDIKFVLKHTNIQRVSRFKAIPQTHKCSVLTHKSNWNLARCLTYKYVASNLPLSHPLGPERVQISTPPTHKCSILTHKSNTCLARCLTY